MVGVDRRSWPCDILWPISYGVTRSTNHPTKLGCTNHGPVSWYPTSKRTVACSDSTGSTRWQNNLKDPRSAFIGKWWTKKDRRQRVSNSIDT